MPFTLLHQCLTEMGTLILSTLSHHSYLYLPTLPTILIIFSLVQLYLLEPLLNSVPPSKEKRIITSIPKPIQHSHFYQSLSILTTTIFPCLASVPPPSQKFHFERGICANSSKGLFTFQGWAFGAFFSRFFSLSLIFLLISRGT